ncbi:MAG TPA: SigE family RNA polymerase sigma factor [Pseudonocardiaceae bacterium]|nr:SigE family RNA polymerase sigma factor [Pseudonocardiaceae bacterium]
MRRDDEERFREFATQQAAPLRRCAYLFCGDWHLAEDLMQTTLVKIYRSWHRITAQDSMGAYARTVLLRTWLDERRRPWRRSEVRRADVPDRSDGSPKPDEAAVLSWQRNLVHGALLKVPPRQRAVLVLRYFDDLSIAQTAAVMGCNEGTVKSQAARGLDNLRTAMTAATTGRVTS